MEGLMKPLNVQSEISYNERELQSKSFEQLTLIKIEIEAELDRLFDLLKSHNADMDTSLITIDGFPRSDIDIVEIRTIRINIIKLRNDLKAVIGLLESKMGEQFGSLDQQALPKFESLTARVPFAIVTEIFSDSPAYKSGLKVNDRICLFGEIDATNHKDLSILPSFVKNNENKSVPLVILREQKEIEVSIFLTREWPGNGLLGCRIVKV